MAFVEGVGTLARKAWWRFAADSLDRFGVGNRREKRGFVTWRNVGAANKKNPALGGIFGWAAGGHRLQRLPG
ncbi:hypothetical protein [Delftia sp. WSY_22]|uniref:hypothetical protein n=1 Tax=Delftia sp. WSY_22 TaxID=3367213 RepID=UPI00370B69E4